MWEHKIFDASNLDKGLWDEFMQLHFNAAKRKTRSEQSWQAQYEMIMQDGAVLICLFDGKNDYLLVQLLSNTQKMRDIMLQQLITGPCLISPLGMRFNG